LNLTKKENGRQRVLLSKGYINPSKSLDELNWRM